jgi:hypothetical protein
MTRLNARGALRAFLDDDANDLPLAWGITIDGGMVQGRGRKLFLAPPPEQLIARFDAEALNDGLGRPMWPLV